MKKYQFVIAILALVLVVGVLNGCDNRSQLEKDADAAAKKVSDMMK